MNLNDQILKSIEGIDGWCEPGKALTLAHYVIAIRAQLIVEIGVWGGRSLFPMAIAARSQGPARILAIDPWKASESVLGQYDADKAWWDNQQQHDLVYSRFIANLHRMELSNIVTVLKQSSNETMPPERIDLLHLDGNHGEQAYTDITRFSPPVRKGGIVVLDDLNWTGGAVGRAAGWLTSNGFLLLHPLGTGAVYLKL